MELAANPIFPVLVKITEILQQSGRLSTSDRMGETRTDEKLFLKMLQDTQALIWRVTRMYCKIEDDQRDLFQEIVSRLWTGFPSYRGEASQSSWVYTVCLHTAFRSVRKKRIQWSALDDLPEALQPVTRPDADDKTNLVAILEGLPDVDKAIIFLKTESYNNREIATIIGIRPNTVDQRLHRLRTKLNKQLSL